MYDKSIKVTILTKVTDEHEACFCYFQAPTSELNTFDSDFNCTYILLTKREGHTEGISARGLDSTDRGQRGPNKKDRGPIFSQYGPEQAWLIRDLLHD